jgi:5-aminolevulinate synthase
MDSVLRQSKAVCPFMKKATVATLRAMSTAARPQLSPCGGTMSNLQVLAHRCPVMGKAMAVQSARFGRPGFPAAHAIAGLSTMSTQSKAAKAKLHTSRTNQALPVESQTLFSGQEKGKR